MFAIFEDGSRQYRVQAGDLVRVDFREAAARGDALEFARVMAAASDDKNLVGRPVIEGAVVRAEVVDPEFKSEKIEGGKFKRRKNYIRHWGHTQRYTEVRITAIAVPGLPEALAPVAAPRPVESAPAAG